MLFSLFLWFIQTNTFMFDIHCTDFVLLLLNFAARHKIMTAKKEATSAGQQFTTKKGNSMDGKFIKSK